MPGGFQGQFAALKKQIAAGKAAASLLIPIPTTKEELKKDGALYAGMTAAGGFIGGPPGAAIGATLSRMVQAGVISKRGLNFLLKMSPRGGEWLKDIPEEFLEIVLRKNAPRIEQIERRADIVGKGGQLDDRNVQRVVTEIKKVGDSFGEALDKPAFTLGVPRIFGKANARIAKGYREEMHRKLSNHNVQTRAGSELDTANLLDDLGNLLDLKPKGPAGFPEWGRSTEELVNGLLKKP